MDIAGLDRRDAVLVDFQFLQAVDPGTHFAVHRDFALLRSHRIAGTCFERNRIPAEELADGAGDRCQCLAIDVLADTDTRRCGRALVRIETDVPRGRNIGTGAGLDQA